MKKTVKKNPATTPSVAAPKSATAPAAAKPAPAVIPPAVAKSAPVAKAVSAAPTAIPTTIEAKVDVGFGNSLFIRGQGDGLSWHQGKPLTNVDSQTWRLTLPVADQLQFKLLINDSIWAQGDDVVVAPGKSVRLTPSF